MVPTGAWGAGVGFGSRIAWGRGGGGALALGWGGGGGGGGGSDFGFGGSTNWLSISTGITTSAARRSNPLCSAQSAAAWNRMTPPAMTTLRERPRTEGGGAKRSDTINHSNAGTAKGAPIAAKPLRRRHARYLRKIHQTEPATRIRLPPSAETSSMPCFP